MESWSGSYTRALEDQVAYLERRLMVMENQQTRAVPTPTTDNLPSPVNAEHPLTPDIDTNEANNTRGVGTSLQQEPNVADVVGLLSLGNGTEYVGSSSGYALATDLGRLVRATVWNKALWVPTPLSPESERRNSNSDTRKITLQELQQPAKPVSDALGTRLITTYLVRIHPRFLFLSPPDLWEIHRRQSTSQTTHGVCESLNSFACPAYNEDGFALFVLNLVYSIGALNLRLTDQNYRDVAPE